MFCCKCGARLMEGAVFCTNCGNRVAEPATPVQPAAPVAPPAPVAPVAPVQVPAPVQPVQPVQVSAPVAPVTPAAPPAPVVLIPPVEEAEAGATSVLSPDQVPGYMAPGAAAQPAQAPVVGVQPPYPVPADIQPAPKKQPNFLLVGILAILAVLVLTVGALGATGALDDLFGGTGTSDRDDQDDKDDKDDNDGDGDGENDGDGDDNDLPSGIGKSTTTRRGQKTTAPQQDAVVTRSDAVTTTTTTAPPTAMPTEGTAVNTRYSKGYISGDAYYNEWAGLMYGIGEGWEEGTAADYATYANATTECGLYLKRLNGYNSYDSVNIYFEDLQGAAVSAEDYMDILTNGVAEAYGNLGLSVDMTDPLSVGLAGKYWQSVKVTLGDGSLYQRYLVTEQDGYIIGITITAMDSAELNGLLTNLTWID